MPPSIYPTGMTIYNPDKCWNGFTVFQANDVGATVIDMNGTVINQWRGMTAEFSPKKILPGGYVMGNTGIRNPKYGVQDATDLVQVDWEGNIVGKFDRYEQVKDPHQKPAWMVRQHHDYQREGNPVGYYVPDMDPKTHGGNTIILSHKNLHNPAISEKMILDDTIIEVTWEGKIIWEWICSDHFDEMGFSEEAKNTLARNPSVMGNRGAGDWMHINSVSMLGPNRWFESGDERFHPDNLIWDGRQTNIMAITDKKTGKIVWQVGPDYTATEALRKLGQVIGQHHVHMIPRGLPGEGNILAFDNGGQAGYGIPNPGALTGNNNAIRGYSRVLEFDPITLEIVWQYTAREAGFAMDMYRFYSHYISAAQRLANGNTLITEGAGGRLFEVTSDHAIVWEYISPYFGKGKNRNMVYRAYRLPYSWIPQADKPEERPVAPVDNSKFRVPGSSINKAKKITRIKSSK
ncbi:MAG: aryl-sulfate sulfotransferase [Dehalococcoidales bacterium]|nr:MAG: aryl-sulfate sulfotransferase [Dehalococcoidales bacterium]